MGAAIGDHRRLAGLGEEDGKRFTEEDRALWAALQILEPRDRLPTAPQGEVDVFAGRDSR